MLNEILDSTSLSGFGENAAASLDALITQGTDGKRKAAYFVPCAIRGKAVKLTPEEAVRQLYIKRLVNEYGYSAEQMEAEYPVKMGRDVKRADIVVFTDKTKTKPYIIVELKAPSVTITKEEMGQLSSYCQVLGASLGILCNGRDTQNFYYNREDKKHKTLALEKITYLPKAAEDIRAVFDRRYTIRDLIEHDELQTKTLKQIILDFEDVVLANSGVDSFEEIFKFIFTKLYDEMLSAEDSDAVAVLLKSGLPFDKIDDTGYRQLEFRTRGMGGDKADDIKTKEKLDALFKKAQEKWRGIFSEGETFQLRPSEMRICVSFLQDVRLFNSNLEVVDDAFEYLVTKEQKGNKGQYFTPRYVIDMCIKMLNPHEEESMIDTAAGSCGFPMHTIFYVWNGINPDAPNLLNTARRSNAEIDYVKNKVFAIDFDRRSVRVGRCLNIIAGDGNTNVMLLNSLEYNEWKDDINVSAWRKVYNDGFFRMAEYCEKEGNYARFNFDIVMANPPFAGDIKNEELINCYALGRDDKGKTIVNISRDILFIERNLNFLRPGGRMAIVLPQGRFNNSSDRRIRDYIARECRILAVVGLHGNTFKPHTGTKTSVLFVQKWTDDKGVCPRVEDYNIFFATQQRPDKDNSGEKIYARDSQGRCLRDKHGHIFVDHDLFATRCSDGSMTQDGIAEAFQAFAKSEGLSFFR